MKTLLRNTKHQKIAVFDTETEGLSLSSSRPWQLSWIICQGEDIIEEHDEFILFEDLNMSEGAAKITNFNKQTYLSKAKPPMEVWQKFAKTLYDKDVLLVGQNILNYDIYILNVLMNGLGMQNDWSFLNRMIDTRALAMSIFKQVKYNSEEDFLCWQMKLMNHFEKGIKTSQGFLLKHYGIEHDPAMLHNALYDIKMNYKIFRRQISEVEI
jgi:DNA polymerase III alpha subunit (gram-positive type)